MRNLWRALALAWLGGVASPGLADDVLQSEIAVEADATGVDDETAARDSLEACGRDCDAYRS
jgi:hypothetical protein